MKKKLNAYLRPLYRDVAVNSIGKASDKYFFIEKDFEPNHFIAQILIITESGDKIKNNDWVVNHAADKKDISGGVFRCGYNTADETWCRNNCFKVVSTYPEISELPTPKPEAIKEFIEAGCPDVVEVEYHDCYRCSTEIPNINYICMCGNEELKIDQNCFIRLSVPNTTSNNNDESKAEKHSCTSPNGSFSDACVINKNNCLVCNFWLPIKWCDDEKTCDNVHSSACKDCAKRGHLHNVTRYHKTTQFSEIEPAFKERLEKEANAHKFEAVIKRCVNPDINICNSFNNDCNKCFNWQPKIITEKTCLTCRYNASSMADEMDYCHSCGHKLNWKPILPKEQTKIEKLTIKANSLKLAEMQLDFILDKYWKKHNQEHSEILLSANFYNTMLQAMQEACDWQKKLILEQSKNLVNTTEKFLNTQSDWNRKELTEALNKFNTLTNNNDEQN